MVNQTRQRIRRRLTSPIVQFVNLEPSRQRFFDVFYQRVSRDCWEISWWWRYDLSEEEKDMRVWSRTRMGYDGLSIFELFCIV